MKGYSSSASHARNGGASDARAGCRAGRSWMRGIADASVERGPVAATLPDRPALARSAHRARTGLKGTMFRSVIARAAGPQQQGAAQHELAALFAILDADDVAACFSSPNRHSPFDLVHARNGIDTRTTFSPASLTHVPVRRCSESSASQRVFGVRLAAVVEAPVHRFCSRQWYSSMCARKVADGHGGSSRPDRSPRNACVRLVREA